MFEKNLEYISNLALKRRLQRVSVVESRNGVSYCITPSNDYVLLKDDIPIDDLNNPREAVRKMFKTHIRQEMRPNDIIINFGIGLGYLLDETYNTYPSRIYIYEPDTNLLHFVLNNVDISEHLASGRVYITDDLNELTLKLSKTFLTKDKVEIVYLQNYAVVKNKELLQLTQKVYDACKSKIVDVNTIAKFSEVWLNNELENIAEINSRGVKLLSDLDNKFVGQTALIAGAGPSLADNISEIKANRNKIIIIAVNKAASYLIENSVTPDFVVSLDARNMDSTLGGLESRFGMVNCIFDIRTDSHILSKGFKDYYVNFGTSDGIAKKLADYNKFMSFNETGGTASTLAFISAVRMGFSRIVFAGIDLAFKDNTAYASGSQINRISPDEILADGIKKNIVQVPSVTGGKVYTRDDYEAFIGHFVQLIKETGYSEVYNLSSFGAYIEGTKNVKFDDLYLYAPAVNVSLEDIKYRKFDVTDFVQEEFKNINNIISMLSKSTFSPALVSSIVKSVLVYQYMQADIVGVLQSNFEERRAQDFIDKTKSSINLMPVCTEGLL